MGNPTQEQVAHLISLLLKNNYISKQDIKRIAKASSPSAIKQWKESVREYLKGVSLTKALVTLTTMSVGTLWLLMGETPHHGIGV